MAHGHDNTMALPRDLPGGEPCAASEEFDAFAGALRVDLLKYFRAHLPTDADAQDAAQESLLRLLRYRDSEPASAWQPLLFRIASNVVAEFYRRSEAHRTKQHVPLDEVPLPSEALEQEEITERRQRKSLLRTAILSLSPRPRQIYLLSRVDGLTYPQIAVRCGISVKAVETSIARTSVILAERVGVRSSRAS